MANKVAANVVYVPTKLRVLIEKILRWASTLKVTQKKEKFCLPPLNVGYAKNLVNNELPDQFA